MADISRVNKVMTQIATTVSESRVGRALSKLAAAVKSAVASVFESVSLGLKKVVYSSRASARREVRNQTFSRIDSVASSEARFDERKALAAGAAAPAAPAAPSFYERVSSALDAFDAFFAEFH